MADAPDRTDAVLDLAKRRGFLYPAFEVYGGMAGFYDYGPLGAAMKNRFESLWRHVFHQSAVPMAEVYCPRVTMHEVLKASGHVDEFTDLVTKCKNGHPHRADHLIEAAGFDGNADALSASDIDAQIAVLGPKCPICGDKSWTPAAPQNLMFNTEIGPGSGRIGYLRPETAQGIFTDFPHLLRYFRGKLPFGGIQVGGSNRNEISPRQGMLRLREFNMMEAEVFFTDTNHPGSDVEDAFDGIKDRTATFVPGKGEPRTTTFGDAVASGMVCNTALGYFLAITQEFLLQAGMNPEKMRFRQHESDEMAHYAQDCWDAEFHSERYGWVECVGVADRGCYDLSQHAQATGKPGDFQFAVELEAPVQIEATKRIPVMGVLGRSFKGEAKAIAQAMDDAFNAELQSALANDPGIDEAWLDDEWVLQGPKDATPASAAYTLTLPDGSTVEVPAEGFQELTGTWTVTGRKIIPRVIEPSFGVDRILYALWEHAYERGVKNDEPYTVMHLSPHVAPIQVAVLPLTSQDELVNRARTIEAELRAAGWLVDYDVSGNIGRRYARQDEVGTPYCITVDPETLQDGAVTVRDRDTTDQDRVPVAELVANLRQRFQATTGT